MSEARRLHETRIAGRRVEPAGAFSVEPLAAPEGVLAVAAGGELDMAAADALRARLDAAAGAQRGLVLDLGEATFVDSAILKELLRANAELAQAGTRLVLAAVPPPLRRLLDLTRTGELFALADDREAALRLLEA